MGHIVNSDGSLTFNNSPSTTADLNALADRIEEATLQSVATVAALDSVPFPRSGEFRLVEADDSTWQFIDGGWVLVHLEAVGPVIAFTSGTVAGANHSLRRDGDRVRGNFWVDRTAGFVANQTLGTVPAGLRPGGTVAFATGIPAASAVRIGADGVITTVGAPGGTSVLAYIDYRIA